LGLDKPELPPGLHFFRLLPRVEAGAKILGPFNKP
jgi:hypothetical protein